MGKVIVVEAAGAGEVCVTKPVEEQAFVRLVESVPPPASSEPELGGAGSTEA